MRVLLINPIIRPSQPPSYFPLGLAYVAAVLRGDGHQVDVMDINGNRWPPDAVARRLRQASFDWAGITGLITEYSQVKWLANVIREQHPHKKIVLGGPLASSAPDFLLQTTAADLVVLGEGESTVRELAKAMEKDSGVRTVSNLAIKQNGHIHYTPSAPFVEDLDSLPFPAWDLFPVEAYIYGEKLGFDFPARALNLITSRGCPYRCIYCFHGISGQKFRYRSPENILAEVRLLQERYRLDGLVISDDLFITRRERVLDFCTLIVRERIKIRWMSNARVNLVTQELLENMKAAGCKAVFFGLETGSPEMLMSIRKGTTVEQAEDAVKLVRKVGLRADGYFMIGMPGETAATVQQTIDFCKRNGFFTRLSYATPLPDTPMFDTAKKMGRIGGVESVLGKWDGWGNTLLVNMTDMSDQELVALKERADREINSRSILAALKGRLKAALQDLRDHGTVFMLKKAKYKLLRTIRSGRDPYGTMIRRAEASARAWTELT